MAFTFQADSRDVLLYQNGSSLGVIGSGADSKSQDRNTHLKVGGVSNTEGFYISNLQFIEMTLSKEEIMKNGNNSFKTGNKTYSSII